MTDAMVTSAPNRVNVSVMHVVSISSDPSAMGTRTRFDIAEFNAVVVAGVVVVDDEYNLRDENAAAVVVVDDEECFPRAKNARHKTRMSQREREGERR
jgi:hypothetical protein